MHDCRNCQGYIWLLSGTEEGPEIAKALINDKWSVSVSVVTSEASYPYMDLGLASLWIGPINGVEGVLNVLENSREGQKGFDWVIDATHPFATQITENLARACERSSQPYLRFERKGWDVSKKELLKNIQAISSLDLKHKRVLFAIGSRQLPQAVDLARNAGAIVFARVLPNASSLKKAFLSGISGSHLAVLRPLQGEEVGLIESCLCKKWSIDVVICRQSEGKTQKIWQEICSRSGLSIWLIERPERQALNEKTVFSFQELIECLSYNKKLNKYGKNL